MGGIVHCLLVIGVVGLVVQGIQGRRIA